jgi:hypothetical protein
MDTNVIRFVPTRSLRSRKRIRIGENLQVAYGQRQGNYGNNSETSQVSNTYRAQPIIPVYDIGGNFARNIGK